MSGPMSLPKERFLREKFLFFESFWKGEGPYPLLFAKPHLAKDKNYLLHDLEEQHRHPVKLPTILPYVPDNQGVFDLTHLIVGTDIFTALLDTPELVHKAQEQSLKLYIAGTRMFKSLLGQEATSMFHAHGMICGVWFPHTGARISEDSCSLVSEGMIREFCLPYIREAIKPFGQGFLHFGGRHEGFLKIACEESLVSTVNLGNSELYDLEEVFRFCGSTRTVYFGHLDPLPVETLEEYLERIAELALRHKAKVILVAPPVEDRERKRGLVNLWHRLTAPARKSYPRANAGGRAFERQHNEE
ncbi:MAG: hypothetical protein N2442_04650 [Spirochaetes bacterium]|nr:hypothetical protein [Spirochaetota bacterium]